MGELELLTMLVSFGLPVLVGLVTKSSWPSNVRAVLLLLLATATAFTQEIIDAGGMAGFDWEATVWTAVMSFAVGVVAHFGWWRPTGASAWAQSKLVKDDVELAG